MSANAITYDEFINHAVDAFLGWHLPNNFNPDGGIVFDPIYNKGTPYQNRHYPLGTNLFDADQARDMFEACIPEQVFAMAVTENVALKARVAELERFAENIRDADWRTWDETVAYADQFESWAKSRARHVLSGASAKEPTPRTSKEGE